MAIEMARVQLSSGRDVLVPQFLGRLDFVLELELLCTEVGADFVEVAVLSSPQDITNRFVQRSHHPETSAHRDASALLDRSGGLDELPAMYERLLEMIAKRPGTLTFTAVDGEVAQAYKTLVKHVDEG